MPKQKTSSIKPVNPWIEDWWEPFHGEPTLKYLGTQKSSGYVIDLETDRIYHAELVDASKIPLHASRETLLEILAPYRCGQW